jgi:hypothetical protein
VSSWSATSSIGPVRRCAVLLRGGLRCAWCLDDPTPDGEPRGRALQVDHVVPRASGGANSPRNLVPACGECNRAREGGGFAERLAAEGVRYASALQRVRRQLHARLDIRSAVVLAHAWYPWLAANRVVTLEGTRRWRARVAADEAHGNTRAPRGADVSFPFGFSAPDDAPDEDRYPDS